MLKVTIEVWPGGCELGRRTLATVDIWNDGSGTPHVGNYGVRALEAASRFSAGVERTASVIGHARQQPALALVHSALAAVFDGRTPATAPWDAAARPARAARKHK